MRSHWSRRVRSRIEQGHTPGGVVVDVTRTDDRAAQELSAEPVTRASGDAVSSGERLPLRSVGPARVVATPSGHRSCSRLADAGWTCWRRLPLLGQGWWPGDA